MVILCTSTIFSGKSVDRTFIKLARVSRAVGCFSALYLFNDTINLSFRSRDRDE